MDKLSEIFKNLTEKFKSLSTGRKIAFGVLLGSVVVVIVYLAIVLNTTKYAVLFSDLDSTDSGAVIKNLDDNKISYKIDGKNILVPEEQVDPLRMKMYSEIQFTDGSPGWEIFDSSGMVASDFENKVKYQRALQGQLERMIKSFDEVKDCHINLVIPEETVFIREVSPAQAAVAIKLNPGVRELSDNQVKAIVALLTGGVKNLPKENVQIAVDGMILATEGLFEDEENNVISSSEQIELKSQYENDLKNKILSILQPIYQNGIRVAVNVDMNFDSKQTESIDYKDGVIVSEQQIISNTSDGDSNTSSSPVDNNFTPSIDETSSEGATSEHSEVIRNYQVPETKEIYVQSPGKIDRISVSVTLDESKGVLDERTRSKVRNLVSTVVGFDIERGDSITVEGLNFNLNNSELITNAISGLEDVDEIAKKEQLERQLAVGFAAALMLILLFITMRRMNKARKEEDIEGFDMIIGDNIEPKPQQEFAPIDFDNEDENTHVVKEVKRYAKDKPDQVADIIKSWLSEDEG